MTEYLCISTESNLTLLIIGHEIKITENGTTILFERKAVAFLPSNWVVAKQEEQ